MASRFLAMEVAGFVGNRSTTSDSHIAEWGCIMPPHNAHQAVMQEMMHVDAVTGHFLDLSTAHGVAVASLGLDAFTTGWIEQLDSHDHANPHGYDHAAGHDHDHSSGHGGHGGGHGGGHM